MPEELISVAAARQRVLACAHPLDPEPVPVSQALGRILAGDLRAAADVPAFAGSAMDGYALQAGPAGRVLKVVGESRAGAPSPAGVGAGQAIRISTGAVVPAGASAVIRQEDASERGYEITTQADTAVGQNIRGAGEAMRAGDLVLAGGQLLGPPELGAAVAAGAAQLTIRPRPQVRVLCTGDELREPGAALEDGQVHNSNGPMLVAYARQQGAHAGAPLSLADRLAATESALAEVLAAADVVIVAGGVSVGPHDHVKPALAGLGVHQAFWGVALQPGKPTWFGTRESTLVFGLPGNPVSAAVTFTLFVAPALRRLGGAPDLAADPIEAELVGDPVRLNPAREQALRVRLERHGDTTLARLNGPQGSHVITSLVGADALAMIPAGDGVVEPGARLALEPLARYTLSS